MITKGNSTTVNKKGALDRAKLQGLRPEREMRPPGQWHKTLESAALNPTALALALLGLELFLESGPCMW